MTAEEAYIPLPTDQPQIISPQNTARVEFDEEEIFLEQDNTVFNQMAAEEVDIPLPTDQPQVTQHPKTARVERIPRPKTPKGLFTPDFKWKSGTPFHPNVHQFDNTQSGIQKQNFELTETSSHLEFFQSFVTPFMLGKVAYETNEYYKQNITLQPISNRSSRWHDTTSEELYLFIAVHMLMARNRKLEIPEYWSTNPLLQSPIFGKIISRNRFQLLLRYLHFCNSKNQLPNDRLFKIDMVLKDIKTNFRSAMVPFQNLVIDESLMLWKGRLSFKQFIRTKRHRFGIKFFILCDVETDYILDFIIYTGKTTRLVPCDSNLGQSGAVVKTLMKTYLNKGHTLYTDNWYTSPLLSMYLHKKKPILVEL